jgi:hypothetical protein
MSKEIEIVKENLKSEKYSKFILEDNFIERYHELVSECSFSKLTLDQMCQVLIYLNIYKKRKLSAHWQVNEFISRHNYWGFFSELRSLNDHGYDEKIKGITPRYFGLICDVLDISADDGEPLQSYEKY